MSATAPDDDLRLSGTSVAEADEIELDEDELTISGPARAQDVSSAPEEDSQSQIPGDPRPVNEQQPPFKEQY